MKIINIKNLNLKQISEIKFIIEKANEVDKTDNTCPINEVGMEYFLLYNKNEMLAFIALYEYSFDKFEILAFTLPEYRNKKYFKKLFNSVILSLRGKTRLYFSVNIRSKQSIIILNKMKAKYMVSECFMIKMINTTYIDINSEYRIKNSKKDASLYKILYKQKEIGYFKFINFNKEAYLYNFFIYPKYRGKGHAYSSFFNIFNMCIEKTLKILKLQVSKSNIKAFNLYTKLGFKVSEQIDNYYIDI